MDTSVHLICCFGSRHSDINPVNWVTPLSSNFPSLFPQLASLSLPVFSSPSLWRLPLELEEGSSVYSSSHHLWNFRARPRWKGALYPPDEECRGVVRQRLHLARNLEESREVQGRFSLGWGGWKDVALHKSVQESEKLTQTDPRGLFFSTLMNQFISKKGNAIDKGHFKTQFT